MFIAPIHPRDSELIKKLETNSIDFNRMKDLTRSLYETEGLGLISAQGWISKIGAGSNQCVVDLCTADAAWGFSEKDLKYPKSKNLEELVNLMRKQQIETINLQKDYLPDQSEHWNWVIEFSVSNSGLSVSGSSKGYLYSSQKPSQGICYSYYSSLDQFDHHAPNLVSYCSETPDQGWYLYYSGS